MFNPTPYIQGGNLVYTIVKNSENVVSLSNPPFTNALPQGAIMEEMEGWKKTELHLIPDGETHSCSLTSISKAQQLMNRDANLLLSIDIYIAWMFGGQKNGEGSYITNATSYCRVRKCDPGLSFNLSASFGTPYNGAPAGCQPIAHIPFVITGKYVYRQHLGIKNFDGEIEWRGYISAAADRDNKYRGAFSWERTVT